jgi:GNAT superfamily N-acetyltransferase
MIRRCKPADMESIYRIINDGALAYKGVIPWDCWHEPYMSTAELMREMKRMRFFGWEEEGRLLGVIGFQPVEDVTLIRHAYVLRDQQRRGIGSSLLRYVKGLAKTRLLVGTWSDATWAIQFYEKHGFRLLPDKDELLRRYWNIPQRQIETSVVLGLESH